MRKGTENLARPEKTQKGKTGHKDQKEEKGTDRTGTTLAPNNFILATLGA